MRVSIRDVANEAGVSLGTVSNALNHPSRVAPETIARVQAAIDRLGFVRNDAARQLRAGQSRTIGLVVLEASNPYFADLARGVEERARASGLIVLMANSDDDTQREAAALDLFEEQRVRGVLVSPAADTAHVERLHRRGVEVVLLERDGTPLGLASVAVDNAAGGRLAVQHLIESGRRHIAFVGGPTSLRQVADRLSGAREAAHEGGVQIEHVVTDELTVLAGRHAGELIASRSDAHRPDAVFAANDLLAIGVVQSLRAHGLAIPDDVAIVGFDDIDFAASSEVPLTSIRQPSRLIGTTAVDLLLERAADPGAAPKHTLFDPEIIVRASTRPLPDGQQGRPKQQMSR